VVSALLSSGFVLLLMFAFLGFSVFVYWRVIEKAGEKGWKALVPVLAPYTLMCLATSDDRWRKAALISNAAMCGSVLVLMPLVAVLPALSLFMSFVLMVAAVARGVTNVVCGYRIAAAFDEDRAMGVLCAMGIVGYAALGLDSSVVYGGTID
jgi:hypothetical protein